MSDFEDFWSLYVEGREYGFKSSDYAGGVHRGQDVPGRVKGREWLGKTIPLLRPGKLHSALRKEKIGGVYTYDVGGGEYDQYCHTHPLGDGLRLSTWEDPATWRGTSYRGPHLHLVRSRYADAAWNTNRPTLDPRPIIRARLKAAGESTAGGDPTPVPPLIIPGKDEDMRTLYGRAGGENDIYAMDTVTGALRYVTPEEWKFTETAFAAAGIPVPYSRAKLTKTQMAKLRGKA